jgi:hypothetical protein
LQCDGHNDEASNDNRTYAAIANLRQWPTFAQYRTIMKAMFSLFWQALTFKRSPEDTPYSIKLFLLVIATNLALSISGEIINRSGRADMAFAIPLFSVSVELVMMSLFLHIKGLYNRLVQTATTIFGGDILLTCITVPLLAIALSLPQGSPLLGFLGLLEVVILGWSLGFRAFVYHRAMNIGLIQANMFALTVFLLTTIVTVKAFPELLTQAQAAAAKSSKSP